MLRGVMGEQTSQPSADAVPGISVVIPCLDEASSIGAVIDAALAGTAKAGAVGEVLVVDNGSTDRSAEIARAHGARVVAEKQRGYGAALRRGFREARGVILVMADGDLTYDLSRLDELVEPIRRGEADFVIGNRMHNIRPGSMPRLHRYVGNPVLSLALRMMFHSNAVRDAHCGMRAIRREAYLRLRCVTTGMEFASEMVVRALHAGLRIAERDIIYHARVGDSKLHSFRDGWRHLRFLMLHSPTTMLLWPGALCWLLGLAMTVPLALGRVVFGTRYLGIHFMLVGGLLNIISMQAITMGLLSKAYAYLSGLRDDPVIAWLYRHYTFEKAVALAVPVVLLGLGLVARIIYAWVRAGYGDLDAARPMFFGILCLVNGVQLASASYLFSIMALPRHVDRSPVDPGRPEPPAA